MKKKTAATGKVILYLSVFFVIFTCQVQGATFTVNTTNDTVDANPGDSIAADADGNTSLRAAIMEANTLAGDDIIEIPAGTYSLTIAGTGENGAARGDLDIISNLTIRGAGKNVTIIDGSELDRVFHIKGSWTVTLSRMTVRNGRSPAGGTSASSARLPVPAVPLHKGSGNLHTRQDLPPRFQERMNRLVNREDRYGPTAARAGTNGGGILIENATVTVDRCRITQNRAGEGEGIAGNNVTAGDGGSGGGIYNDRGTLVINNCTINQNSAGNGGETDYDDRNDRGGIGGGGGGIYSQSGTVTINDSSIRSNRSGEGGYGHRSYGGSGGGLVNAKGSMTLNNCKVVENLCGPSTGTFEYGGDGGGIYTFGPGSFLGINNCIISYNQAGDTYIYLSFINEGGCGGGIYSSSGTVEIHESLINGNRSGEGECTGSGGGICNLSGTIGIRNTTISGNYAPYWEYEFIVTTGGIDHWGGTLILESCTVVENDPGGISNMGLGPDGSYRVSDDSVCRLHNTVCANNNYYVDDADIVGWIISRGYNLIKATSYGEFTGDTTGSIYGTDPYLGPLTDNGGPTKTHALLAGSPGIDAGDPNDYETTDQRGILRPKDGDGDSVSRSDMGAYEKFTSQLSITRPKDGATVWGPVDIGVDANTRFVDIHIDGNLVGTAEGAPHSMVWNSATVTNGTHKIKAVGYDMAGSTVAQDAVEVKVNNTVVALDAQRHIENAWLLTRHYGKLSIAIGHIGGSTPVTYVVERKEGNGVFATAREIPASEIVSGSYLFYDPLPNNGESYTYLVKALDENDRIVGQSAEMGI